MVWDPARITPATWSSATVFFRNIEDRNADFRPLRQLAEHVAARPYAPSVFCATSGTSLLIAPRPDADWAHDALRIDIDLSGAIRLTRHDPQTPKPTTLTSSGERLAQTLERFLVREKWIEADGASGPPR